MKQQAIYRKFENSFEEWFDIGNLLNVKPRLVPSLERSTSEDQYMLDHFLWLLYCHSVENSNNFFEALANKLYLHYDWEVLFKSELEQQIIEILQQQKKAEPISLDLFPWLNNDHHIQVNQTIKETVLFDQYIIKTNDTEDFAYFISRQNLLNINRFIKINCKLKDRSAVTGKINEIFIKAKEDWLRYLNQDKKETSFEAKDSYNDNLYSSDLLLSEFETNEIIQGYSDVVNLYARLYYSFFLKTKLKAKLFDFYEIETNYSFISSKLPRYNTYGGGGLIIIKTYRWKCKKTKSLETLFERMKLRLSEASFEDFKAVFTAQEINDVKPLKTNFSATELIYFLDKMMTKKLIETEKNLNIKRLKACFVRVDGSIYKENLSPLRSQLKKDDHVANYDVLTLEKRKNIDALLNSL